MILLHKAERLVKLWVVTELKEQLLNCREVLTDDQVCFNG